MFLPATTLITLAPRAFGPYTNMTANSTVSATGTAPGVARPAGMSPGDYSNLTISINGGCGGSQTCLGSKFGQSCSKWGYCGTNSSYSGAGCQPAFGLCGNISSTNSSASVSAGFSTATLTTSKSVSSSTKEASSGSETPRSFSYAPTSTASKPSSTAPSSAAIHSTTSSAIPSGLAAATKYKLYLGNGEPSDGWPAQSMWLPFETLWAANHNLLAHGCAQFNVSLNSEPEMAELKDAILSVSKANGVDSRFVLATVMQESKGCVRAPTTKYSVSNPGLMQSYNGKHTCNPGSAQCPQPITPCPASEITAMIQEGVVGSGPGATSVLSALQQSGKSDVAKYYWAARIYNSGKVTDGVLQEGVATKCYASDIANRLLGWADAPTTCHLDPVAAAPAPTTCPA